MLQRHFLFLFVFVNLIIGNISSGEMRTFTDATERQIQAEIIDVIGSSVRMRRNDGLVFTIEISKLSEEDQLFIETWKVAKGLSLDKRIKPGNKFMLSFPELAKVGKGEIAGCEVQIPKEFKEGKPVPLFVWISGGSGSKRIKGAKGIVDFDKYVVVGLPIAQGVVPRIDYKSAEKMKAIWDIQGPMLKKLRNLIPNLNPNMSIVCGTSNGAHVIGTGLDQRWDGFYDFFNAFIMHEGGACPSYKFKGANGKKVLVLWGAASPFIGWQKGFNKDIDDSRAKLTMKEIPGAKHGLTQEGRKEIRKWIDTL